MKTSISVPDDLWDCVKDTADGPSAVVQEALSLLCQKRKDPMTHAPSDEVKDKVRDAVAAQIERVTAAARKWTEDGYELGVALAEHLSLVDLLSLPSDQQAMQAYLDWPMKRDSLLYRSSPLVDFWEFRSEANIDQGDSLYENPAFWGYLELAVERHLESLGQVLELNPEESDPAGRASRMVLRFEHDGSQYNWAHTETPVGWQEPTSDPEIGRYFMFEGHLPGAYVRGISGALIDIRNAVAAHGDTLGQSEGAGLPATEMPGPDSEGRDQ